MENLDLAQLESLFFALLGIIFLILVALVVYVVLASRRQRARMFQPAERAEGSPTPERHMSGRVLSLVRDEAGAALSVEIDGVKYRCLTDIEDPQVRRRVLGAAAELIQFTGVLGVGQTALAPVDETVSWREDMRRESKAELDQIQPLSPGEGRRLRPGPTPDAVEERFLTLLAEMSKTLLPAERPSLVGAVQRRLRATPEEPDESWTVVDEIEEIIQRRVQLIPALAGRGLHVRSSSGGSVRFVFEGQEYKSLEEVPNLTAQRLIKDSIREWEETA